MVGKHKKLLKRKSIKGYVKEIKKAVRRLPAIERGAELFPTGCTVFNLALSDSPHGGYVEGSLVNIVGDSDAGKTFLLWHLFAEVVRDPRFDDVTLIYDEPESKMRLDLVRLFGPKIKRVKRGLKRNSDTIEEFYASVRKLLQKGQPFIYGLDSFDSLSDKEERARKELKRDYPAKARLASEMLRKICRELRKQNSLLCMVSQLRQRIGITFGESSAPSGGRALKFYCTHQPWLAVKRREKRRGKEVGVHVIAKTKKNHLTGKLREVEFPIYYDYGIDDVRSMIWWMVEEGFWSKPKGSRTINTEGDFGNMTEVKLIRKIEGDGLVNDLIEMVGARWREVEDSIRTDREPRYR